MTIFFVYLSNFYIIFSLTKYICYDNWAAKMSHQNVAYKEAKDNHLIHFTVKVSNMIPGYDDQMSCCKLRL